MGDETVETIRYQRVLIAFEPAIEVLSPGIKLNLGEQIAVLIKQATGAKAWVMWMGNEPICK
ncbi:MAG: hypothetical protein A2Z04_06650 [Chloroflexi bacterium RBG_16_57_9]|nr:MAG: hypothetical protein A2Z04_06650 [Chloroflexi bacterium RBG_16_57_9]